MMKEKIIEILESHVVEVQTETYCADVIHEVSIDDIADEIIKLIEDDRN